jgi:hypothetical protein
MSKFSLTLIILFTVQLTLFSQELSHRISFADAIVEGKVISREGFWNDESTLIYTTNKIEIYKSFKGNITTEIIEVRTRGGIVGDQMLYIPHSNQFKLYQEGIIFLKVDSEGHYILGREPNPTIEYTIRKNLFKAVYSGQSVPLIPV